MMESEVSTPVGWVFDPALPSGARSGGNAAKRAFTPDVGTLVREVLQNSKDAALGARAAVAFRLVELSGGEAERFLRALEWEEGLRRHVEAAAAEQQQQSRLLDEALERLEHQEGLMLLIVEDRLTSGLTGAEAVAEPDEASRFASLCRDELYSSKSDETSGGSHGMGKAMLWQFSGLSLVLFNSLLAEPHQGRFRRRLIGRAALPWHRIPGEGEFNGGGWFGYKKARSGRGDEAGTMWATSVWDDEAAPLAEQLHLTRPDESGTSIMVVDFFEPAHEDRSLDEVAADIASAASEWFWPSLLGPEPSLEVTVHVRRASGQETTICVDAASSPRVQPFVAAYQAYQALELADELRQPGEVVCVPVEIELPRRRDEEMEAQRAQADLVVRLAAPNEAALPSDAAAYFRGAGMVVRYRALPRLSLTAKRFHALLVAGAAREGADVHGDLAMERFLRAAEPPEHNEWTTTENLKVQYQRGYRQALLALDSQVREELRRLVSEQVEGGRRGPARLAKLFPIGTSGGGDTGYREFVSLSAVEARLNEEGGWDFSGKITALGDVSEGWEAAIEVRFNEEDNRDARGASLIAELEVREAAVPPEDVMQSDQGVEVIVPPRVPSIHFFGRTDPGMKVLDPRLSSIAVSARGRGFKKQSTRRA